MTEMEKLMNEMLEEATTLVKINICVTATGYQVHGRTAKAKIRALCEDFGADADETIVKVERILKESDLVEIIDQVVNALPGGKERIKYDVLEIKKQMEELKDD